MFAIRLRTHPPKDAIRGDGYRVWIYSRIFRVVKLLKELRKALWKCPASANDASQAM
jgi:hypothetical protein